MRIVIAGGGQIGHGVAKALAVDHEVFVIDHDPTVADVFQTLDIDFILGDDPATYASVSRDDAVLHFTYARPPEWRDGGMGVDAAPGGGAAGGDAPVGVLPL